MTQQPLDLRTSAQILWRGRVALLLLALFGLSGGIAYGLSTHSQPKATALVYVPPQTSPDSLGGDVRTQTVIAMSSPVVTPALMSLSPRVPLDRVTVTATGIANTNILRIGVRAPVSRQAVQSANAVASAYINYAKRNGLVTGQPLVVQPAARAASPSATSRLMVTIPLGLVAGVLIGTVVLLVRSRRDHRLRGRDEIANALGLPVLATIEAGVYKTVSEWTRFLQQFQPSPAALWSLRRVLHHGLREPYADDSVMQVVSFADDRAAVAAGPQLALAAAELGVTTSIQPSAHDALKPLRAACARLARQNLVAGHSIEGQQGSNESPSWDSLGNRAPDGIDLVISVAVVDRTSPRWTPFVGRTVLAITAGAAVADELASLALTASEGGGSIEGIVLVNPEPGDARFSGWRHHGDLTRADYPVQQGAGSTAKVVSQQS